MTPSGQSDSELRDRLAEIQMLRVLAALAAAANAVDTARGELVPAAVAAGVPIADVARAAGLSRPTIYKLVQNAGA